MVFRFFGGRNPTIRVWDVWFFSGDVLLFFTVGFYITIFSPPFGRIFVGTFFRSHLNMRNTNKSSLGSFVGGLYIKIIKIPLNYFRIIITHPPKDDENPNECDLDYHTSLLLILPLMMKSPMKYDSV